jgi:hypothetical protein
MVHKIYQHLSLQDPPKSPQILDFGFESKPSGNPAQLKLPAYDLIHSVKGGILNADLFFCSRAKLRSMPRVSDAIKFFTQTSTSLQCNHKKDTNIF